MDTGHIFLSVLVGSVGIGLIMYGIRARRGSFLASGVLMMACPYMAGTTLGLAMIFGALILASFLLPF